MQSKIITERKAFNRSALLERHLRTSARAMAAYEPSTTTKLYERTKEQLTQDEVEWIKL